MWPRASLSHHLSFNEAAIYLVTFALASATAAEKSQSEAWILA